MHKLILAEYQAMVASVPKDVRKIIEEIIAEADSLEAHEILKCAGYTIARMKRMPDTYRIYRMVQACRMRHRRRLKESILYIHNNELFNKCIDDPIPFGATVVGIYGGSPRLAEVIRDVEVALMDFKGEEA